MRLQSIINAFYATVYSVCAQTNHEGVFIDLIHYSRRYGGIIMVRPCSFTILTKALMLVIIQNPGAFCHDS